MADKNTELEKLGNLLRGSAQFRQNFASDADGAVSGKLDKSVIPSEVWAAMVSMTEPELNALMRLQGALTDQSVSTDVSANMV